MAALTLNQLFYERYIKSNFYLNSISYNEESLYIENNGQIIKQVNLESHDDLAKLPVASYRINDPFLFLDVLEINNECEKTINTSDEDDNDLTKTVQIDRMYLPTRFILIKNQSTEEDDKEVIEFLKTYNKLVNANGYLTTSAEAIFKQMSSVLRWTLEPQNNKPQNNAQLIIKEYIQSLNNGNNNQFLSSFANNGGMEKGTPLMKTNPNAPSVLSEDYAVEKYGFLNISVLVLAILNLLVLLVIMAIK